MERNPKRQKTCFVEFNYETSMAKDVKLVQATSEFIAKANEKANAVLKASRTVVKDLTKLGEEGADAVKQP